MPRANSRTFIALLCCPTRYSLSWIGSLELFKTSSEASLPTAKLFGIGRTLMRREGGNTTAFQPVGWQWKNAVAGSAAGLATVSFTHPLDVIRTRFQVNDGRMSNLPTYKNTIHALFNIAQTEVTHGAIQFTPYEELRKAIVNYRSGENEMNLISDNLLNSIDYAMLGASSKVAAVLATYPSQVIRARLQQQPSIDGIPRYMNSWRVIKDTARFEGLRGFYKGITANILKNAPAASLTFIVYENVLNMLKLARMKDRYFYSCHRPFFCC